MSQVNKSLVSFTRFFLWLAGLSSTFILHRRLHRIYRKPFLLFLSFISFFLLLLLQKISSREEAFGQFDTSNIVHSFESTTTSPTPLSSPPPPSWFPIRTTYLISLSQHSSAWFSGGMPDACANIVYDDNIIPCNIMAVTLLLLFDAASFSYSAVNPVNRIFFGFIFLI